MLRPIALAALLTPLACFAAAPAPAAPAAKIVAAAPAPPPPDSSHTPKQPVPLAAKPAHPAPARPAMSEWRRAYIAKHGHAPGAPAKAAAHPIAKPVAHAGGPAPHKAAPMHRYRKCV